MVAWKCVRCGTVFNEELILDETVIERGVLAGVRVLRDTINQPDQEECVKQIIIAAVKAMGEIKDKKKK